MAADWLQELVEGGIISSDQLVEAEQMASSMGIKVEEALIKLEYVLVADLRSPRTGSPPISLTPGSLHRTSPIRRSDIFH